MCGIAGMVRHGGTPPDGGKEEALLRSLAHRGPDASGSWRDAEGGAMFLHTRLSIIDLSAEANQPFVSSDGRHAIVFNGEIYNYRALRTRLASTGWQFRTDSDTEVLLAHWIEHGTKGLRDLRGMFAFAVWDRKERTLALVRDFYGIKPLYHAERGGELLFASEVRTLIAALPSVEPDALGIEGFLRTGSVPEPRTAIAGVSTLPAGHVLVWKEGRAQVGPWCEEVDRWGSEAPASDFRDALKDSVRAHLVADVPVGVFLSGGLDSTALLALAATEVEGPLHTFSIGFGKIDADETPLAARTAKLFGSRHHEKDLTDAQTREWAEDFLGRLDQPSVDGFNTYCVSRAAREQEMKVCLSGLGGDELLGGYQSFAVVPRLTAYRRRARLLPPPIRKAIAKRWEASGSSRQRRLGEWLAAPPGAESSYHAVRSLFTASEARAILRQVGIEVPDDAAGVRTRARGDGVATPLRVSRLESERYMRNQLLRDTDVMGMAHGLELRVPFLDREIAACLEALPESARFAPGKRLLRDAVPELPQWVLDRPKQGFSLPFDAWFDGAWRDLVADCAAPSGVPMDRWYRRWAVAVLNDWLGRRGLG